MRITTSAALILAGLAASSPAPAQESYESWRLHTETFPSTSGGGVIIGAYRPVVAGNRCTTDFTATLPPPFTLPDVTSQPVHPDIVDYYLQLLPGVPSGHARQRLLLLSVFDTSPKPLTQKILERPRVLDRLRRWIGDPRRAYLTRRVPRRRRPSSGANPALASARGARPRGARSVFAPRDRRWIGRR